MQTLQGCFKPARKPHIILDYKFERCPLTYQSAASHRLVKDFDDGLLTASFETRRGSPAKKMQAIMFVDYLRKLRQAHEY